MAVKVGDKYLCNIPETVSKLIEDVEALKDQTAGTEANVYKLIEGQAFDEDLFNKMKIGDIVIVNNIPFVITKSKNKIEGYYFNGFGAAIIYGSSLKIEWKREDILKFNIETMFVKDLSFIQTDIKAKSLETTNSIVGKTISQKEPNWEVDIKSILNPNFVKDSSKLYAKLCLLGNELSLVISGIFTVKEDGNAYKSLINNQAIDIPDEIAEKIYRADGTTLKESPSSTVGYNNYISAFSGLKSNPSIGSSNFILSSSYAKNLVLVVYSFGATTEDAECYIDARLQLTII